MKHAETPMMVAARRRRRTMVVAVVVGLLGSVLLQWFVVSSAAHAGEPARPICKRWRVTQQKATAKSSTAPVLETYAGEEPFAAQLIGATSDGGQSWWILTRQCAD